MSWRTRWALSKRGHRGQHLSKRPPSDSTRPRSGLPKHFCSMRRGARNESIALHRVAEPPMAGAITRGRVAWRPRTRPLSMIGQRSLPGDYALPHPRQGHPVADEFLITRTGHPAAGGSLSIQQRADIGREPQGRLRRHHGMER